MAERGRYRFGPLERRGLIAGWRGGQIVTVAAGLAVAIVLLGGRPRVASLFGAVAVVGGSLALAWWPLGGRTAEEWAPTVLRWSVSRRRRARLAPAVGAGHCVGPDGLPCAPAEIVPGTVAGRADGTGPGPGMARSGNARPGTARPGMARPGTARPGSLRGPAAARSQVWGGLSLASVSMARAGAEMGVIVDRRARTYTAVLELLGHSFSLLGSAEKDRRVGAWAAILASFARQHSVVHRLQWVVSTIPDDDTAALERPDGAASSASAARRSYASLVEAVGSGTRRHEVLLGVQLRASGAAGRAIRSAGGGDRAAAAVLDREVASLRRALASADVPVERVLGARDLAGVVRRIGLANPRARGCPPCGVAWPWPVATAADWGCVRTDEMWHATYWISEWPRTDVGPEFLAPLLLGAQRRSVSLVMEPLDPLRAVRKAERARTADVADAELRRRGGFLATARRAREAELATRREAELADGHASYRFVGYVTVSVPHREQLAAACEAAEQAASQSGLELRRLFGDQERALACTLPLGRGLA